MTTYEQVRQAYKELSDKREQLMDREREALRLRVDEAMLEYETEFSRLLHQAREAGMSMVELRQASRQYGNPTFKRIWDLTEGPTKPDNTPTPENRYEWVDSTTLAVTVGETEVMLTKVQWFDEPEAGRRTPMFDLDSEHLSLYADLYKQAEAALVARDEED